MASRLLGLFDETLRVPGKRVAGPEMNLDSIADNDEEREFIISRLERLKEIQPRIDYSDFANFVFFNSALDYFNITAEKILNDYPIDGGLASREKFYFDLDGYQRHVFDLWPRHSGYLDFKASGQHSYVSVVDSGFAYPDSTSAKTQKVGVLSPGSGSISVEFWCQLSQSLNTPEISVIMQKGATDGYSVFASGSGQMCFRVTSGSDSTEISVPFVTQSAAYYCFVYDRTDTSAPQLRGYTGSLSSYPVQVSSASSAITGRIDVGTVPFYVASGSVVDRSTRRLSASLDELRIWSKPLDLSSITGTFNVGGYSQPDLLGLWHFDESGSVSPDDGTNSLVYDRSGHGLTGRVVSYSSSNRKSGSLCPFVESELIMNVSSPEVSSFVLERQLSGSEYDRSNDNAVTRLFPEQVFILEDSLGKTTTRDFLNILARSFDSIKLGIDQFVNNFRISYGDFDNTPDALLKEAGEFFGWDFDGNFLSADAVQYLTGKGVLGGLNRNDELDVKLFQIKNEFWRRTLNNLSYLYKTKGTKESVESLLRVYGLSSNFVRLKEYGTKAQSRIRTERAHLDKSSPVLAFVSSSDVDNTTGFIRTPQFTGLPSSVETRVMFSTTSSLENAPALVTGSIWTINSYGLSGSTPSGSEFATYRLYWTKPSVSSVTGTLHLSGNEGVLSFQNVGIFNGSWYNVCALRDVSSGTLGLSLRRLDYDTIDTVMTSSLSVSVNTGSYQSSLVLGASGTVRSQMYAHELRLWSRVLNSRELDDHVFNFQSYGTEDPASISDLFIHMRLNENVSASLGTISRVYDSTTNRSDGVGAGFVPSVVPYEKFLFDYNHIIPVDTGWTTDKIRIHDGPVVPEDERVTDYELVSLEFGLIDALNEDISQMFAVSDSLNERIGAPVNRFRESYQLDSFSKLYFSRLQGGLKFRVFWDMLEFFDRTFLNMIQRLIPARAVFMGDELVVESHMLERPKMAWTYRRQDRPVEIGCIIKVTSR